MNKMMALISIIIFTVVIGLIIYYSEREETAGDLFIRADDSGASADKINAVARGNNDFALALFNSLKDKEGNVFLSPYSISSVLAMALEGAQGKAAEEIISTLHLPTEASVRQSGFAAIHNQLNKPNSNYKLALANSLWIQNDYALLGEYVSNLQNYYASKARNVDFRNSSEESRLSINDWVKNKTNNKVKDLLLVGAINPTTRLILTNAVYFKGAWASPFEKSRTKEDDFHLISGDVARVPMMSRVGEDAEYNYYEADVAQILEMPYAGNTVSMIVVLPKDGDISLLESSLSGQIINDWMGRLVNQRVDVTLPKFNLDAAYSLGEHLVKMGMPSAFNQDADFSGMIGERNLFIDEVFHGAFINVNEEGSEAAAGSGAIVAPLAGEPQGPAVFRADRPFLFFVQDKQSGVILFFGRVANPAL